MPTPTSSDWKGPNFSNSGTTSCNGLATKVSLFPTPTASLNECETWKENELWWKQSRASRNLASLVKHPERMWRTPNTFDSLDAKSQEALEHELEHRPNRAEPNNLRDQMAVREGMRYWPTPCSKEPTDFKKINHYLETGEDRISFTGYEHPRKLMLAETVIADAMKSENLPTPTSRDWKDGTSCDNVPENGLLGRAVKPNKVEGALSADWTELLMGYPKGYTVVEWQKKRKNSKK